MKNLPVVPFLLFIRPSAMVGCSSTTAPSPLQLLRVDKAPLRAPLSPLPVSPLSLGLSLFLFSRVNETLTRGRRAIVAVQLHPEPGAVGKSFAPT